MSKALENLKKALDQSIAELKKEADKAPKEWFLNPENLKLINKTDELLKQVIRMERN